MAGFGDTLKHAWDVFFNTIPARTQNTPWPVNPGTIDTTSYGPSYGIRPDRVRLRITNERSIISSIYTRLSIDVASVDMRHVRFDDEKRYLEDIESGLNNCLTVEANLDQAARAFRQDAAMTIFDKGCAAIVPVDTSINPTESGGYDILSLRVGEIVAWYPQHVKVSLYNEAKGRREEITLHKSIVAIV